MHASKQRHIIPLSIRRWGIGGWICVALITLSTAVQAAPGELDAGFGIGGGITTSVVTGAGDIGRAIAVQEDGKMVVAGYSGIGAATVQFSVLRLNGDGSPDNTFGGRPVNTERYLSLRFGWGGPNLCGGAAE